ncbi:MAG: zinc dependent phospholipase C family protein [Methanobacterium sp.]|nr:zinc dependent phospholipase C family protein [Methanobacterium sp.]
MAMGSSFAWNAGHDKTHELIVTQLYQDMPTSISQNLDLAEMKKGANYPDVKDSQSKWKHAYPASTDYAEEYLKMAMNDYKNAMKTSNPTLKAKFFKDESFHLGMASHYISDTFAAPHTTNKMKEYQLFYSYADQITHIYPTKIPLPVLNLKTHNGLKKFLEFGKNEGYKVAQYWNNNQVWKNPTLALKVAGDNLDLAYAATLAVFKQWLGF